MTPPDPLRDAARSAATRAYVPYSQFRVGAAVLTRSGAVIAGCNVENASYGLTVCAERNAVFQMVAAGDTAFDRVVVYTPTATPTAPCGACRQVLNEFKPKDRDMIVILDGADPLTQIPLAELLPRAFGPQDLDDATGR